MLYVSHDRELLARTADRVVTVEGGDRRGRTAAASRPTTTPGGTGTSGSRSCVRRWDEEHERLKDLVRTLQQQAAISPDMASRYHAMQTRLRKFEEAGPPQAPPEPSRTCAMRLRGGRTGVRAVTCERLELTGLMQPFDLEVFYGERVAVLGSNGSGKSHFLRLLAGGPVAHTGEWQLGARVVPGQFAQTHEHPELVGRTLLDVLWRATGSLRARAGRSRRCAATSWTTRPSSRSRRSPAASRRGSRSCCWSSTGATLLLLDEPTDNLDLASAEALEDGAGGATRARCWRSPTTGGSPARSTGSWSSGPTAGSTRRRAGLGRGPGRPPPLTWVLTCRGLGGRRAGRPL